MVSAINSALSGLHTAGKKLEVSAQKIASSPTQKVPQVDVEKELVNQNTAATEYKANLNTIKVANEMQKSLLDIIT